MNYFEFTQKRKEQYNSFPMFCSFNETHFTEWMARVGAKDKSEILHIGFSMFVHKDKQKDFIDMRDGLEKELEDALKDTYFFRSAIRYELNNREYCITNDATEAIQSLWLSFEDFTDEQKEILKQEKKRAIELAF